MPQTVTIETGGGPMPLLDTGHADGRRGAVVVVQEAFGVNAHIADVARRFAEEGYRAVAPHLFHRTGDPIIDYSRIEDVMPHMGAMTEPGLAADLDATLRHLSSEGLDLSSTAVVGFCMGGTVAFLAATRHALGGAVTFYGGGVREGRFGMPPLVDLAPRLRTPWLGLYGDLDRGIPVADVEALGAAARDAPVPTEIVRYPDAEHGFFCDARAAYNPEAATDAWQRTLAWFDTHLASG